MRRLLLLFFAASALAQSPEVQQRMREAQQAFGTPKRFLDVVRAAYRAGAVWLAYYAMQRQKDGRWRANGCHLAQPAKTVPT